MWPQPADSNFLREPDYPFSFPSPHEMLCSHQDAWLNDGNQICIIMSESNSLFTQDVPVQPRCISCARLKRVTFYTTDRDHWSMTVKHSSDKVERRLGMRMYILHPEVLGKECSCWCSTFFSLPCEPNAVTFAWHTWIRSSAVKLSLAVSAFGKHKWEIRAGAGATKWPCTPMYSSAENLVSMHQDISKHRVDGECFSHLLSRPPHSSQVDKCTLDFSLKGIGLHRRWTNAENCVSTLWNWSWVCVWKSKIVGQSTTCMCLIQGLSSTTVIMSISVYANDAVLC